MTKSQSQELIAETLARLELSRLGLQDVKDKDGKSIGLSLESLTIFYGPWAKELVKAIIANGGIDADQ